MVVIKILIKDFRNFVSFVIKHTVTVNNVIFWTSSQDKGWWLRLLCCTYITKILNTLFIILIAQGHKLKQYTFHWNKFHIWRTFESPQKEACWFQLAVCCFTLWVLELVIPRMKRVVWGTLFCSSHCAISLYPASTDCHIQNHYFHPKVLLTYLICKDSLKYL